jgi:predicted metalloprotease
MRWTPGGSSDDVEDRRNESGGGRGFQVGGIHLGLGGVIVLFVLSLIFKRDFLSLLTPVPWDQPVQRSLSLIPPVINVSSPWYSS